MKAMGKIVAIIPARGGSKGIPRKNVRILAGKPLICYALENAKKSKFITDAAVTSDSPEILGLAKGNGVAALRRRESLAEDSVTLDPVVYDAVTRMEAERGIVYDVVVTLQPTSPLLKAETLDAGIAAFLKDDKDSYVSVVNRPHLSWRKTPGGYAPNHARRVNRQQLEPVYVETGAFFLSRRSKMSENNRLGSSVSVFEIPEEESVDVDTPEDWLLCEHMLSQKTVCFYVNGDDAREAWNFAIACRNLAYHLTTSKVAFVCDPKFGETFSLLESSFFPLKAAGRDGAEKALKEVNPHLVLYLEDFARPGMDASVGFIRGAIARNPGEREIYLGDGTILPDDFNKVFGVERIKRMLRGK